MSFAPTAILASLYVNAHLPENHKPTTPRDFIPGMEEPVTRTPVDAPESIPMTPAEAAAFFGKKG